jgi:hypothetical protein
MGAYSGTLCSKFAAMRQLFATPHEFVMDESSFGSRSTPKLPIFCSIDRDFRLAPRLKQSLRRFLR